MNLLHVIIVTTPVSVPLCARTGRGAAAGAGTGRRVAAPQRCASALQHVRRAARGAHLYSWSRALLHANKQLSSDAALSRSMFVWPRQSLVIDWGFVSWGVVSKGLRQSLRGSTCCCTAPAACRRAATWRPPGAQEKEGAFEAAVVFLDSVLQQACTVHLRARRPGDTMPPTAAAIIAAGEALLRQVRCPGLPPRRLPASCMVCQRVEQHFPCQRNWMQGSPALLHPMLGGYCCKEFRT